MNIQQNKDLTDFNTFRVKVTADYFVEVTTEKELEDAIEFTFVKKIPYQILGGGSNVLFVRNFQGMIIHIRNKGIFWGEYVDNEKQTIDVSAGEDWHNFVTSCLDRNLYGLENLALIPGTVGGAPIQNIGAYGVEVKDLIKSVRVFDVIERKWLNLLNQDCGFNYRSSVFRSSSRYVVFRVLFDLDRQWKPKLSHKELSEKLHYRKIEAADIFDEVCKIRSTKLPDPRVDGNAGSFFKNPFISVGELNRLSSDFPEIPFYSTHDPDTVKIPAAWLLDNLGWKGKNLGDALVSANHALVIINQGGATGRQIYDLAKEMSLSVFNKYGITLVPEVKIIDP